MDEPLWGPGALFLAFWGVGVIAFGLSIVEMVCVLRFVAWPFRNGFVVLRDERALPHPGAGVPMPHVVHTPNAVFRFTSPELCHFRRASRCRDRRLHSPFPIKGTIRWHAGLAIVEGRVPVYSPLVLAAWLLPWTAFSIALAASSDGSVALGIVMLVVGWGMCCAMVLGIRFERRYAREGLDDLRVALTNT